jgi:hypothetical protein
MNLLGGVASAWLGGAEWLSFLSSKLVGFFKKG